MGGACTTLRRPRLGYLLAAVAAAMFAVNGSIAKLLLEDGVSAAHLSQLRVTVSFVLLAGALALVDRRRLRIARADVARMAWLGSPAWRSCSSRTSWRSSGCRSASRW